VVVTIRLLGEFSVVVDGQPVAGYARRSAAALIQLLALEPGRRLHRERVMDALWPDAALEDAANSLYKAAHFARRATGADDCVVLRRETVILFPGRDVHVDLPEFEAAARAALTAADEAAAAAALTRYGGELLPEEPYAAWAARPRQHCDLLHRELLRLARRWADLVALDPTDEQAALCLAQALLDSGNRSGALREVDRIETVLRDELGIGLSPEGYDLRVTALDTAVALPRPRTSGAAPRHAGLATQTLGFCRAEDGIRLAYATSGQGPPLVKVANWLTHLDYDWASPVWSHWWQELSRDHRLVRYDERGSGLSDWDVDSSSFTIEAWVRDLETVVDTLGLDRFALFGMSQGGPIAITYAARHPDRVSRLIVYGTCARSTWLRASAAQRSELAALGQLIRLSWGSDQPGFRQIYDARFLPDGPLETWRAFDQLQRRSTTPENAYRLWRAFGRLDASDAARSLDVPTLLLHARQDQVWSFEEAEELHTLIRGSRLVGLDSRNHILRTDEPAFDHLLAEVRDFLGAPRQASWPAPPRS
jgi:DNA-binding SARP family transcriptional activator/pimeloyl-ACP methyl ester carboxylesterase